MIVFDIETGPQEGLLESRWAPIEGRYEHEPFDPESVKRLKKETDAEYAEKVQLAHEAYTMKAITLSEKYALDQRSKREEFLDGSCLHAHLGRVLAIGVLERDEFRVLEGPEAEVLGSFWSLFRECSKRAREVVGHYITGFDLPFMIRRSWALEVDVPAEVFNWNGRYLSWHPLVRDTAQLWLLGQYVRDTKWSLDAVGYALGSGGKVVEDVSGKGWWRTYAADRAAAMAYLENDCRQAAAIYQRMAPPSTRV
jgi:hypothetical protein